ncbi:hypothetical protein K402DRAFT_306600, partial [Aulographum hederae CBS 113979]
CAMCAGHGDPDTGDCMCETKALEQAIAQAEKRWVESWMARIRDWVQHRAVTHVTTQFETLKAQRLQAHKTYLWSIPNFEAWMRYQRRPPLHPYALQQLQRQIADADARLKRGIDADWKTCVIKYPEVLDYFYNQVQVQLPRS